MKLLNFFTAVAHSDLNKLVGSSRKISAGSQVFTSDKRASVEEKCRLFI